MKRLPENLASLSRQRLRDEVTSREARLTPLFRRWPGLNELELEELRFLYHERLRVAKHRGKYR